MSITLDEVYLCRYGMIKVTKKKEVFSLKPEDVNNIGKIYKYLTTILLQDDCPKLFLFQKTKLFLTTMDVKFIKYLKTKCGFEERDGFYICCRDKALAKRFEIPEKVKSEEVKDEQPTPDEIQNVYKDRYLTNNKCFKIQNEYTKKFTTQAPAENLMESYGRIMNMVTDGNMKIALLDTESLGYETFNNSIDINFFSLLTKCYKVITIKNIEENGAVLAGFVGMIYYLPSTEPSITMLRKFYAGEIPDLFPFYLYLVKIAAGFSKHEVVESIIRLSVKRQHPDFALDNQALVDKFNRKYYIPEFNKIYIEIENDYELAKSIIEQQIALC